MKAGLVEFIGLKITELKRKLLSKWYVKLKCSDKLKKLKTIISHINKEYNHTLEIPYINEICQ